MALTGLTKVTNIGINTTTIPTLGGSRNTGVVTATNFIGDGSGLTGVTGSGAGVIVRDGGSLVGTAGTINFGTNLNVSAISAGIVTVTNAASATALTNLSDVTISSPSNGQVLKYNGSAFVNAADADTNTTYSQSSVASGSNVNLRLTDNGGTNDDILITAGSNITFSSVTANGFTIAASGGGGGGGLSNVVEDTTPQLGGILDLNNKFISGSGGINVSGVTTSTQFVGNLTGNVTGNVTGNADTATHSTNFTVTANNTANETVYPIFVDGASGNQGAETDTGLTYNPSTNLLTAGSFSGSGANLTGVVTSIVAGSNITLTGGPTGIVTIAAAGGGSGITDVIQDTTPQLGGNLDLNSKNITGTGSFNVTGVITATSFVGNITGNVTGNTSGSSGSCTGNAATATALQNARTIGGVSFDGTGNINLPGVNTTGNQDTTGNAGTATTATTATNVTLGNDSSGSTARRLVFASADTGNVSIQADTSDGATYTPSNGRISAGSFATISGTSSQFLKADGSLDSNTYLTSGSYLENVVEDTTPQLGGNLDLNSKNITGTGEIRVVGLVTATSAVKTWTLGSSGNSHYTFTGDGFTSATNDPDIYLERGKRYAFLNNAGGTSHPFQIRVSNGGSAYTTGVTYHTEHQSGSNSASQGYITFNVPWDAPANLYYQCTAHGDMGGNIYIRGAGGGNNKVGVTTITGGLLHIKDNTSPAIRLQDNDNVNSDFKIYSPDGENHLRIYHENTSSDLVTLTSAGALCFGTYNSNFASNDGVVSIVNAASSGTENTLLTLWNPTTVADSRAGIDFLTNAQYGTGRDGAFIRASNDGVTAKAHIQFGTIKDETYTETVRIASDGDLTLQQSATLMSPGATLNIISDKNVETDVDNKENYHLVLANPNNDTGEAIGLAFGITDTTTKVGAAIVHERDAAGSQGSLKFFTRHNNAGPPTEKVRIMGTSLPTLKVGATAASSIHDQTGTGNEGAWLVAAGPSSFAVSNDLVCRMNRKSSNGIILQFRYNGSSVGSFSTNSSSLPSDRNFKTNISNLNLGLSFVNKLKPSQFNYKIDEPNTPVMYGLIAQELEESLTSEGVSKNSTQLIQHHPTDDTESDYDVDYGKLTPVLINAIKELSTEIETLKAKVAALEGS